MTPEDMRRITGVTPSQESEEVRRQLREEQRAGDWLGWVLLAMVGFGVAAILGAAWFAGVL